VWGKEGAPVCQRERRIRGIGGEIYILWRGIYDYLGFPDGGLS